MTGSALNMALQLVVLHVELESVWNMESSVTTLKSSQGLESCSIRSGSKS